MGLCVRYETQFSAQVQAWCNTRL